MTELKPVSSLMASCLGAVILTVSSLSSAAQPAPVLDAMDVFDLEWASDPQVAPDGKSVIYVRRSFDVMSDAAKATLWQVAAVGTDHRPLNSNSHRSTSPRWSPDGKRLLYVSSVDGSADGARPPELMLSIRFEFVRSKSTRYIMLHDRRCAVCRYL